MVAIFTGAGTGTERGSATVLGAAGTLGSGAKGRSGEQVMVNAANGNLIISQRDEFLVGRGPDVSIGRTYNSLGGYDGANNDRWQQSTTRRILNHSGGFNTVGSTVQRQSGDGAIVTYRHDGTSYVATDGAGAYDRLRYDGTTGAWTWDDGASAITETYEVDPTAGAAWRITQQSDNQDGSITFTYNGNRLHRATTSDGSFTQYDWITSGDIPRITQIVTGFTDLQTSTARTLTRTRYDYDLSNRLSRVTVDLTPDDNSVGDANTYYTDYGYHGSSTLVASVVQKDGSRLAVSYDGSGRVQTLTQLVAGGTTRVTTLTYQAGSTTVTDASGRQTRLEHDATGALTRITAPPAVANGAAQVVQFAYNGNGDLTAVTDAAGAATAYTYDARGNLLTETDRLNATIVRTYEATRNLMVTETRTGSDKDGAAQEHTTRFVYDDQERLNYTISPEGIVKRYSSFASGRLVEDVLSARFDLTGLSSTSVPSRATLDGWWYDQVRSSDLVLGRSDIRFDSRGNVAASVAYSRFGANYGTDFTGERVDMVYDQAGQLLRATPTGRPAAAETYVYDGMGRVVATTDANGGSTSIRFDDAQTQTVVTVSSGLVQTSVYNKVGGLLSATESATSGYLVNGTTTYRHDAIGRLRTVVDQVGISTHFLYDGAGRKTAEVSHWGGVAEYRYDANDRVIAIARYASPAQAAAFAALSDPNATVTIDQLRPTETIASNGTDIWEWIAYDAEGRVTRSILGDGSVTTTEYDASGQPISTQSHETKLTASQLAALRAGTSIAQSVALPAPHADDAVTRYFYDRDGRAIATLDAEGYLTRTIHDAGGRKAQDIAYATATNPAYRATGTLQQLIDTTPQDGRDRSTRYVFNGRNQLRYAIDAMGRVTSFDYAATNTSIPNHHLDQAPQTTRYAGTIPALSRYDEATVRAALAPLQGDPANRSTLSIYNERDQLAYTIDEGGAVTGYTYDTNGNVIRERRYDTASPHRSPPSIAAMDSWVATYGTTEDRITRYYYTDRPGELRLVIDPMGFATRYDYDAVGRSVSTWRYDAATNYTGQDLAGAFSATTSAGTGTYTRTVRIIDYAGLGQELSYNGEGESRFTTMWLNGTRQHDWLDYPNGLGSSDVTWNDAAGRTARVMDQYFSVPETTSYNYDGHGNIVAIRNARSHSTTREHDRMGRVLRETDAAAGQTSFEYNAFGDVVKTTDARGNSSFTYYDTLGRVIMTRDAEGFITETAYTPHGEVQSVTRRATPAAGAPATWPMPYAAWSQQDAVDANGNATGVLTTRDHWFRYDAKDRVVTSEGTLGADGVERGPGGTDYLYSAAGEMVRATRQVSLTAEIYDPYTDPRDVPQHTEPKMTVAYDGIAREDYAYTVRGTLASVRYATSKHIDNRDGTVTVIEPVTPGDEIGSFTYDLMGRMTRQRDFEGDRLIYDRETIYYGGSTRISIEDVSRYQGSTLTRTYTQNDYGSGSTYALGSLVGSTASTYVDGIYQGVVTTANTYEWRDGAVLDDQSVTQASGAITSTDYNYDGLGQLISVNVGGARPHVIEFVNDVNGQAIRRDESRYGGDTPSAGGDPHDIWYRFGGREMGHIGNNGTRETGYAASIADRVRAQSTTPFRNGIPLPTSDFSQNPPPVTSFSQGGAGGGYTVQAGDTLAGIAANLWGDANLWYKLAEANGLGAGSALAAGQQLAVPVGVQRTSYTAATFNPYDPAEVLGDTSPLAPSPAKAPKDDFGREQRSILAGSFNDIVFAINRNLQACGPAGHAAGADARG